MMVEKKYISFEPWLGGFSNVRMSYELAIAISIITNRTIILPPKVFCHFLSCHNVLNKNSFIDIWDFLDREKFISNILCEDYYNLFEYKHLENEKQYFENVNNIAKCIIFESKDVGWFPNSPIKNNQILTCDIIDQTDFDQFSKNRDIVNLNLEEKFIHFPRNLFGHFYYHIYGKSTNDRNLIKDKIKNSIVYKKEFYDLRNNIKYKLGNYNSIHIRRNDFVYVRKDFVDYQTKNLLSNLLEKIPTDIPLYIATDETDMSYFEELKRHYNIFFISDFYKDLCLQKSLVVDQLVCVESEIFLGSRLSTFSDYINILRGYENKLDFHRIGTNFSLPILKYNKYPWEVESYKWENIHKYCWTHE